MKKMKWITCSLLALFCFSFAAGCGKQEKKETNPDSEPTSEPELTSADAETQSTMTAAADQAPQDSVGGLSPSVGGAYASGTYYIEAANESTQEMDRLQFKDGVLIFHSFSSPSYGKGGYGPDASDPLESSPYYQKTIEEVIAMLEKEGRTVTISQ